MYGSFSYITQITPTVAQTIMSRSDDYAGRVNMQTAENEQKNIKTNIKLTKMHQKVSQNVVLKLAYYRPGDDAHTRFTCVCIDSNPHTQTQCALINFEAGRDN